MCCLIENSKRSRFSGAGHSQRFVVQSALLSGRHACLILDWGWIVELRALQINCIIVNDRLFQSLSETLVQVLEIDKVGGTFLNERMLHFTNRSDKLQ